MDENKKWSFWIDRGGTFTDVIARRPDGKLLTRKVLSESSKRRDSAVQGIKEILAANGSSLAELGQLRMGTTIGTNALLTRQGAKTVFISTKGFADCVKIAYQNRPDIFALEINLPEMLYEQVIEFDERIDFSGKILTQPDLAQLKSELQAAFGNGIRSCAIALMHGYKYPQHEMLAADAAREIGFEQISVSHESAPLMKLISRADTTLADAYLTPLLHSYIEGLRRDLGDLQLHFMQSNGGLAAAAVFKGKDSILSGPAGGLVGAIKAAESAGFDKLISFDMGGTSTDVSHFHGEIEHIYDTEISGMRIRAPMMDIHTVAAGGGSVLGFDGTRLRVGPDSAGANPGPLCYRKNGPLTLTDANLKLGRIQAKFFPHIFGPNENEALDVDAVNAAFEDLRDETNRKASSKKNADELAYGFIQIAVAKMANAIKHVSIQRGHDVRDCVLVCFGGAGGQHACLIAEELGISKILIHPLAGLLSAYGIGLSNTRLVKDIDYNKALKDLAEEDLIRSVELSSAELGKLMSSDGVSGQEQKTVVNALIQMAGSDYSLSVPFASPAEMSASFAEKHLKRYGFNDDKRELILASLSVQVLGFDSSSENYSFLEKISAPAKERREITLYSKGAWHNCALIERNEMQPGEPICGPALIGEENTTTVIDDGWQASVDKSGSLILTPQNQALLASSFSTPAESSAGKQDKPAVDPIDLELFNNLFKFIAEQMGLTLQNTSQSVNIKERLDFSCALFDAEGNLVANAPHIPVHLGSMGESVKSLIENKFHEMQPGDAFAINDPYSGGTHLPDITIISPAFDADGKRVIFYVASRGHHADIGGITPGSMPADSKSIDEEGILFQHMLVMRNEKVLSDEIEKHLRTGKYPARKASQNIADMKAQIAANSRGIKLMNELIATRGEATVAAYMGYVQDNAEDCVRRAIKSLNSGSFSSKMDDGSTVKVTIEIDKSNASAQIDFTGTSAQTKSNFNAPLAVCKAAVLYVFRSLVRDEIPLNAGCFRPLKLIVPEASLINPTYPAPVVAGNVETSQLIVDVLYAALGIMAASQGTMNNLSFGNQKYQYYETICGGTGAGATFNGAGPVQSHMTNSRLTDPEVLESNYPVILESFSIRKNSGGDGFKHGGNGAIRKLRFAEEMTATVLSNRRDNVPHGLSGGEPGSSGNNLIQHVDGSISKLPFRSSFQIKAGECIIIETPGGGGFGPKEANR